MAAQPLPLNIQEFHRLYDGAEPAYEYWFGTAVRKPMPTLLHGVVQLVITFLLENAGWNTSIEVRLKVSGDAEPIPDLIAVRGNFAGHTQPKHLNSALEFSRLVILFLIALQKQNDISLGDRNVCGSSIRRNALHGF